MSKLNFSKGKFGRFIQSRGFYVAVALCLAGAGAATWLAVDKTITGIENNNNQMIESENQWNDYPEAEDAETKQKGVLQPPAKEPSQSSSPWSSSSSSSARPSSSSEPAAESEPPQAQEGSRSLAYALPVANEIIGQYSNGELVKNVTLNDWRTHDGVDIAAEKGDEVYAAADGVVSEVKTDPLWGTVVVIDHPDGNQTVYCGLDNVLPVKAGESVMVKQVIGKVEGVPCEVKLPTHLHFAMKRDGKWIDPISVLQKEVVD